MEIIDKFLLGVEALKKLISFPLLLFPATNNYHNFHDVSTWW